MNIVIVILGQVRGQPFGDADEVLVALIECGDRLVRRYRTNLHFRAVRQGSCSFKLHHPVLDASAIRHDDSLFLYSITRKPPKRSLGSEISNL